jgi:hypothetical protein
MNRFRWLNVCRRSFGPGFRRMAAVTLPVLIPFGIAAPARAQIVITPTFDSSITSDPNAAAIENTINQTIQIYENKFSDPINVTIKFSEMTTGLGQSTTGFYNVSYLNFITALHADATTANDATALALLPIQATNPVTGTGTIDVKSANLRAVGLAGAPVLSGGFDGAIGLNTHITDVGSPGTTGQYSLMSTTAHEIDEVLGLGSSLASVPFGAPFTEDLFRYDASGNRSFTTNSSAKAFFSIDGTTQLAQFDNQNDGGDFGDWQSNPRPPGVQPKVQDAFATPGANPALGVELTALDVIGYDLVTGASSVPEPSMMAMVATGALLMAGFRLRRRNSTGCKVVA